MFCILPCAVIKDQISLSPIGQTQNMATQMDKVRSQIRKLSDIDYLLQKIKQGDVIMAKKVSFDSYLQSHVDLMKSYVTTNTSCPFIYSSYFTSLTIDSSTLGPKDQWALQIVISRLNLSSIYQAGSIGNMRIIFNQTANSYKQGFNKTQQLIKNIQMTYQYFNQAWQPLKRLLPFFDAIQSLASPSSKLLYPQLNKNMFQVYHHLITCNLAYLKIQKQRLLGQYKKCKQGSWAIYLRIKDCRTKLNILKQNYKDISSQIQDYFQIGQIFFKVLALYFILLQHEQLKNKQDYGFIKKQFQNMIYDNLALIQEGQNLINNNSKILNGENDNVRFAYGLLKIIQSDFQKFKYRYNINVHENKMERPNIEEVIVRRVGISNIWDTLDFF